jgi:hypothetical protein
MDVMGKQWLVFLDLVMVGIATILAFKSINYGTRIAGFCAHWKGKLQELERLEESVAEQFGIGTPQPNTR